MLDSTLELLRQCVPLGQVTFKWEKWKLKFSGQVDFNFFPALPRLNSWKNTLALRVHQRLRNWHNHALEPFLGTLAVNIFSVSFFDKFRQYGSYKVISLCIKTIVRNFCSTFFASHDAAFGAKKNSEHRLPDMRFCRFALVYLWCGRTDVRVEVRQRDHDVTAETSWMDR